MSRYTPTHRRPRQVGAVVATAALLAGGLVPLALSGTANAATLLPGPAVSSPTSTVEVRKEVVLDWAPVAGATGYVVELGTDEQWSDDPVLTLTSVATRITLPTSLPHTSYVWRVAAVGADGPGRWSANGSFTRGWRTVPSAVSPKGDVPAEAGVPTFQWTPVPTASEYQLQVSNSPFFDAPFNTQSDVKTESCFTSQTRVTPFNGQAAPTSAEGTVGDCVFTLLGSGEDRYWRVRALDHVVDDAPELVTSPIVDEGVSSQPPAKADELDTSACPEPPKSGAEASASPSPSSSASPSASPSAAPAEPEKTEGSCDPAHVVEKGLWSASTLFTSTSRPVVEPVIAYDDLVNSDTNTVTGQPRARAAMPTPTLSSDVCAGNVCRDFPTISWAPVPEAQWYRVYVALDADYTNIHEIAETPGLSWTPTHQWRDSTVGASYYVIVQPCTVVPSGATPAGRPGCDEPSAPAVFRKSSPAVDLHGPADAALTAGGEQPFTWQPFSSALRAAIGQEPTSEAYAYRLQVTTAANPDFRAAGLVEDVLVDTTHYVSPEKTYGDGKFLWRVQAVDASGHRLPWSTVRSFVRDATPPTAAVSPTGKLAVNGSVKVTFSEPVTGIDAASVSIPGVSSKQVLSADRRSVTLTPTARLVPGAKHVVSLTAGVRDLAGNALVARKVAVQVDPLVDDRSAALGYAGTWSKLTSSNAVGRTWSRSVPTRTSRTSATVAVVGRGVEVKGCMGPGNGIVEVWVDGVLAKRVDTYRSWSGCGVVLSRTTFADPAGVHRVQLRGTGSKRAASKGTAVGLDAITALP